MAYRQSLKFYLHGNRELRTERSIWNKIYSISQKGAYR